MPVAARFHNTRDKILAKVDDVFAEPVLLTFFKNGVLDSNRPAVEIEAVLRVGGGKITSVAGGNTSRSWNTRIAADKGELYIDRAKYTELVVPNTSSEKTKVRALSRWGTPWFEVLNVDDRSMARLVLGLGEA